MALQCVIYIFLPVDDLVVVDVKESFDHLLHHLLDLSQGKLDINVGQESGKIVLGKIEYQVERGFVP